MYLKSFDDVMLKVNVLEGNKGTIVINHGFSEHLGRYHHVAKYFNDRGYAVITYDLRGHGNTLAKRGHLNDYESFIKDCHEVVTYAKERFPDQKLYVLGHSMGGLISTLYALRQPSNIEGLILSGPALYDLPKSNGIYKAVLSLTGRLMPSLVIPNPVGEEICSVQEVVEANLKDPLVLHRVEIGMLYQFLVRAAHDVRANQKDISLPVLILHGERDRIVLPKTSMQFYEKISSKDKTLKVYPKLYHEIFNEKEREVIFETIEIWLNRG